MNRQTRARLDARARILKALAHPTRLFIIEELARGERCVCELQEKIDADMSTVSKHLAQLRSAGVVQDDKRGSQVFYSLRVTCVLDFLGCIEGMVKENAEHHLACAR